MRLSKAAHQTPRPTPALVVTCLLLVEGIPTLTAAASAKLPAPTITALTVTPTDHKGRAFIGETLTIAADATSADPSRLEYQFLFDGTIIQPWSPNASCQRAVTGQDRGLHAVTVQVRDSHGQAQQEIEIYVIPRPIGPPD